jgi:hypothetical protein
MTTEVVRRFEAQISDVFAFVRSQEVNRALAAVTQEQLLQEQILRNGESSASRASEFNPYAYNPSAPQLGTRQPLGRANYAGGADVNQPTKIERIQALASQLEDLIEGVKKMTPEEVNRPSVEEESDVFLGVDELVFDEDLGV